MGTLGLGHTWTVTPELDLPGGTEAVIHPVGPHCHQLTPFCPTAPLLSCSAAQVGDRKIKNAPFVSSQARPPAKAMGGHHPVTTLPSYSLSSPEP